MTAVTGSDVRFGELFEQPDATDYTTSPCFRRVAPYGDGLVRLAQRFPNEWIVFERVTLPPLGTPARKPAAQKASGKLYQFIKNFERRGLRAEATAKVRDDLCITYFRFSSVDA